MNSGELVLARTFGGKKVLVTGHTGFKGSWLTAWLLRLGAEVIGLSKDVPTSPAMFEELALAGRVTHHFADVRNLSSVQDVICDEQPEFLFHLAAQAIVSRSYSDPAETITTNAVGTMNVLEALRGVERPCVAVLITSDKSYNNVEWAWGYRENDPLGGKDVYSGSKAAAETIIRSYVASFFTNPDRGTRIGVGRAGNVIGGGDWAADRIVVDCVKAWSNGLPVELRSPQATRPWQHVLEPLSGYLTLAAALSESPELHGEAFNFGPRADQNRTVLNLIQDMASRWGRDPERSVRISGNIPFHEASLLKLNCDKALFHLKWEPTLEYSETIAMISDWYKAFYAGGNDMFSLTNDQLAWYQKIAGERGRVWARA